MRVGALSACVLISAGAVHAQSIGAPPYTAANAVQDTASAIAAAQAAAVAQAMASAPVLSVDTLKGVVVVLGSIRATCTITSFDSTGLGACTYGGWSGGLAFSVTPDCYPSLSAGSTSYVYALPPGIASVSVIEQAALKLLSISLGLTTVWTTPPTGTAVTMFCRGS